MNFFPYCSCFFTDICVDKFVSGFAHGYLLLFFYIYYFYLIFIIVIYLWSMANNFISPYVNHNPIAYKNIGLERFQKFSILVE